MLATHRTDTNTIEDGIINWSSGLPKLGCNQGMIDQITKKGFYCDGHFLVDYKGNQTEMGDVPSCMSALNSKPDIQWN